MSRILIVDDNVDLLPILRRHLEQDGHVVETAGSLDDLRSVIECSDKVHLAIVDFWLGKDTGINALTLLRDRFPDIPVLILSGGGNGLDLETTAALSELNGASGFLFKPVAGQSLRDSVRRSLERGRPSAQAHKRDAC